MLKTKAADDPHHASMSVVAPPNLMGHPNRTSAPLQRDVREGPNRSKHVADHRERAYAPRGLRRPAAADWVGMSPTKFDELVRDGLMPRGKLVRGCRVWDRYELDTAFENLPDEDEAAPLAPTAGAWDKVS